MAKQISAGLLMYRLLRDEYEYFLVHPGGPFFSKKDAGSWTIPKGLPNNNEPLLDAAKREFFEETGITPSGHFIPLDSVKQKSGKVVTAWMFQGEWNPDQGIQSNTFTIEWPPRSGRQATFPEIDKARWMNFAEATTYIIPEQIPFLERAKTALHKTL